MHTHDTYLIIVGSDDDRNGYCAYAQQPPDIVASDVLGNTAMGLNAMFSNAGGIYNTAAGSDHVAHNTIGNYNAAFGTSSLNLNVSGNQNAAFGAFALYSNQSGTTTLAWSGGPKPEHDWQQ